MDLIEWIECLGPKKVSNILDVSTENVQQWKRCETSPKTMMAHQIIERTHGMLSWESIYMPYVRKKLAEKSPDQLEIKL